MMTTCHTAVLHCEQTKATALAHFDGCATSEGARKMVELVVNVSEHNNTLNSVNGMFLALDLLISDMV